MSSIKNQPSASESTIEITYQTVEEALNAIENNNGWDLEYCIPELKNNEEVVMVAIIDNSWAFEYASDDLKSNKAFIMKAINDGVDPCGLVEHANITIQSDIEIMTLALEKSNNGGLFFYAQEEVAINKELAAKALVKWENIYGSKNNLLWYKFHPTIQEFFPEDSWFEKAQSYLNQLEQEKQAEMTSGGAKEEDGVVW